MTAMYDETGREPMLHPRAVALLFGVSEDVFRDEVKRQGTNGFQVPKTWLKNGRRRQRKYEAATGRTDMHGAIEYWAQEEER